MAGAALNGWPNPDCLRIDYWLRATGIHTMTTKREGVYMGGHTSTVL